jgi:hypothetical protein
MHFMCIYNSFGTGIRRAYLFFFLVPLLAMSGNPLDSVSQNSKYSWFIFTAGYRLPVYTGQIINSGHGVFMEVGVNAARLFSKRSVVGLYLGWGWRDNLWSTGFKQQFVTDYENSLDHEHQLPSLDSAIIAASPGLFHSKQGRSFTSPGCEMTSFHNYSLYYGILIKLPLRVLPAIKVYRGSTRSHYQGPADLITKAEEYNNVQLRRSMYGCELMAINPFYFLYKNRSSPAPLQKFGISVYYEYTNFSTSSLYFDDGNTRRTIELKKFVSSSFLKKYAHENIFGFKLSYNLY